MITLIGTVSIAIIGFGINFVFFQSRLEPVLFSMINLAIVASIFSTFFEVFVMVFRAGLQSKKYSLFWILFSVGKPLIGIGLIYIFDFKIEAIFWGFLIVPLILDGIIFYKLKLFDFLKLSEFSAKLFKQFAKYGIPISLSIFSMWILSVSDRYLVEFFRGSAEVGLYGVGYSLSEKIFSFTSKIIMLAAFPIIIDNWEKNGKDSTQQLITELTRGILFFSARQFLVIWMAVPEKVLLIFSDKRFIEAAPILPFIGLGVFLNGLTQYVIKGFELRKETTKIACLVALAGAIDIGLNIILIPRLGFLGAGISASAAYTVYFIGANLWARQTMAWRPPYRSILKSLVAAAMLAFYLIQLNQHIENVLLFALLIIPSGVMLFFAALIVLKEITPDEIQKGYKFIHGLLGRAK